MEMLITYDVETATAAGQRRLRTVAKICEGSGIRVQQSVFEVVCSPVQKERLLHQLQQAIEPHLDSIRVYPLPAGTLTTAVHYGASPRAAHHGDHIL